MVILAFLAAVFPAHARAGTQNYALVLPDGRTFPPECFMNNIGAEDQPVHPSVNCSGEEITTVDDPATQESPFINTTYVVDENYKGTEVDENGQPLDMKYTGWIGYQSYGEHNGKYLILTVENGGGTGYFNTLALYSLTTDDAGNPALAHLETIAGGDRCNGGVDNASFTPEGHISFGQNITPYDILTLPYNGEDNPYARAYDDIDSCAICCAGVAQYTNERLESITLDADYIDGLDDQDQSPTRAMQSCYAGMLKSRIKDGKTTLTSAEIGAFVHDTEEACLNHDDNAQ